MNFIKKRVDSFALTTFYPTKEYSILLSATSSYNISVKSSSYASSQNYSSFTESNRLYHLINQLFYNIEKSPYYFSSRDIDNYWFKSLNSEARVIFIPTNLIGIGIKPGSVQLSASSNTILASDNYYGQLIDNNASNVVSSSNLAGWWSFDEGYKTNGVKGDYLSINVRNTSEKSRIVNGTYKTGIQSRNNCISLDGDGYVFINEYKNIDLEKNDDFSLSFWLNIPTSQSVSSSTLNTVVSKGDETNKKYFFKIDTYNHTDSTNQRKIRAYRKDVYSESAVTSSALSAGTFNHIVFQKTGSTLQLYVNNSSAGTVVDGTDSNVYFKDFTDHLILGGYEQTSSILTPDLSGSIDEVRFYDKALTSTEISQLYTNPYNTNIVGNVYYKHGIVVLNNQSGSYGTAYAIAADTLKYKSIVEIREMKAELTKFPGEFNFTLNPSVFVKSTNFDNKDLISTVSSSFSNFSPYITTIGLLNEKSEVIAVAKLKRPIKSNQDLPIKFVIRMDI